MKLKYDLSGTSRAVFEEKIIALNAYMSKEKVSNWKLSIHFKKVKMTKIKLRVSNRKEIIIVRVDIKEFKRKFLQKTMNPNANYLKRSIQLINF